MKILVLTHRLPYAPNRGDRIRAFHIINTLAAKHDVRVVSLVHDDEEASHAPELRARGIGVYMARVPRARNLVRAAAALPTRQPLTHVLLAAPGTGAAVDAAIRAWTPDVVFAYCSGIAPLAMAAPLARFPLVLDFVDVDSAKWDAFAHRARFPRSWVFRREARCLSVFEAEAARAAFASLVVNERECDELRRLCPDADVRVVPNGVDLSALAPSGAASADPRVIFTAVFNYRPNVDGARWFARYVWPRVLAAMPSARLTLAGAHPTSAVLKLAASDSSIEVTGSVTDMRPYLWRSAVAVAPIFEARGVQNKVLEALAAGLPSVVTPVVRDGLPPEALPACRVAASAADFAQAVVDLLSMTAADRRRQTELAPLSALGWRERLAPLSNILESAGGSHGRDAVAC
jgi:sugar transferase (PEP-CTERM/EpsH1 system associated)